MTTQDETGLRVPRDHEPHYEGVWVLGCEGCFDRLTEVAANPAPAGLDEPESTGENDRGHALEWSVLTRALDASDDEMIRRGHRLSSYANEEYAVVLRARLAESREGEEGS